MTFICPKCKTVYKQYHAIRVLYMWYEVKAPRFGSTVL